MNVNQWRLCWFGLLPAEGSGVLGMTCFIYDVRRSKSFISDKDVTHFQSLAEMRRYSPVFPFLVFPGSFSVLRCLGSPALKVLTPV